MLCVLDHTPRAIESEYLEERLRNLVFLSFLTKTNWYPQLNHCCKTREWCLFSRHVDINLMISSTLICHWRELKLKKVICQGTNPASHTVQWQWAGGYFVATEEISKNYTWPLEATLSVSSVFSVITLCFSIITENKIKTLSLEQWSRKFSHKLPVITCSESPVNHSKLVNKH